MSKEVYRSDLLGELQNWLDKQPHSDDGGPGFGREFANFLVSKGFPLFRVSFTLTTMHPEVLWRTVLWQEDSGIKVIDRSHVLLSENFFTNSPVPQLVRGGPPIRVLLDKDQLPYPICDDMRKLGGTDYYAQAVPFTTGNFGYISWVTKREGGFTPDHLALLDAFLPSLARRIELESSYHVTRVLLEIYLGKNASKRVLAGAFKRGQGEIFNAAIWFCDLRGFTEFTDRNSPQQVIKTLDAYFDVVATAVEDAGGEVLKFIGDAALAIFPVGTDSKVACQKALTAARAALKQLKALNLELATENHTPLEMGIALHLGEVMYGNIGGRTRLDFTVISSAVNEASRLESLCKQLQTPLTLSKAFVEAGHIENVRNLGEHALKGVKVPLQVFTLAETLS